MITIAQCYTVQQARMLAARLEAEGLHPLLPEEFSMEYGVPYLIGTVGIRVQLPEAEAPAGAAILQALAAADAESTPGPDLEPEETLIYKTVGEVHLALHVFKPPGHQSTDRRPGVVFFFGGGWRAGTPSQFYPHCQYLASRGMLALSADYRVLSRHGTTPFECVADGKSAIRWLRAHAGELGLDPERIVAGGGSAGGHVAAAVATSPKCDDPGDDLTVSARPNALVLFNPVLDTGPDGFAHKRLGSHWREVSPAHNIGPGIPPTIIFLGTEDKHIPVSIVEAYQQRVIAAGGRCDLWTYPGQPHGFFNYREGSNPYYRATLGEADRFLASLGCLTGPPTLAPAAVPATPIA